MQLTTLAEEAARQLEICNACRYCEGYCAVFPALERRLEFSEADVLYIANLCHDCRACYYACPFVEPHEYALNLPLVLSQVRRTSYARFGPIPFLRGLVGGVRDHVAITIAAVVVLLLASLLAVGAAPLGTSHIGPGGFYEVLPWLVMVVPGMALGLYVLVSLAVGAVRFLRTSGGGVSDLLDGNALGVAGWEALTLRWLHGGDEGCHYPAYEVSSARTWLHFLVAGGFLAAFVSTVLAAVYQDILGQLPPYDLFSAPVVTGTLGGLAMIAGSGGLLLLKSRGDRRLTSDDLVEFDVAFLVTIGLASLTGVLVLALRDSAVMPALLVIHLAVVTTLYVTTPYGKFAHFTYRYAALVRNRVEAVAGRAHDA